jgi:hypothetical protein
MNTGGSISGWIRNFQFPIHSTSNYRSIVNIKTRTVNGTWRTLESDLMLHDSEVMTSFSQI